MSDFLWSEFKKGDKSTFIELYKLHYHDLYNYGMRISRNDEITRDCIQDLFEDIWSGKSRIKDAKHPKSYMFKVLRYKIIDALKLSSPFIEQNDTELYNPILTYEDIIIQKELGLELNNKLKFAIDKLSNRQREVIYLRFYNGLNYEEIADITSIKYQSIRNLFSSAIKLLRKHMMAFLMLFLSLLN